MGSNVGDFDQLAEEIKEKYEEKTVLDDWVSRTVSDKNSQFTYYHGGNIAPDIPENFFVPVTANRFVETLTDSEKRHVIGQLKGAAERDDIDVNVMSDYTHNELVNGFGKVRDPSVLLLPTKKGRPKRLTDQFNRVGSVPYGASDVDVQFVSSDHYSLERGIVIDSSRVDVHQVPVGNMDIPSNFTPVSDGSLSDEGDLVQLMRGKSNSSENNELLYRTVFSDLQGIFDDTAGLIELPD